MAESVALQVTVKPLVEMLLAARLAGAAGSVHCEKFVELAPVPPEFTARTRK